MVQQTNKIWIYDIETLSNCFTYTALDRDSNEKVQFVIWKDENDIDGLVGHLENSRGLIGFNNLSFDYPVLHFILNNYSSWDGLDGDEITSIIYQKAQETIQDEWSGVRDKYIKIPQLDLFRIWHFNNKARMTSLKKLEIAMRMNNVKDMPYNHAEEITEYSQVKEILDYNLHDVVATKMFYEISIPKIELRRELYKRYGLKALNYPDSKIGEELMLQLYCEATGENPREVRKRRTRRKVFKFNECIPDYINYDSDEANEMLDYLKGIEVTELKGSFKHSLFFTEQSDFQYDMGTGGIHGSIKSGVYKENKTHMIVDVDVKCSISKVY